LPILWKTLKQDGHEGLRIDPVPGYAPPNGHTFDTMWAQSAGEKISYQGHKGLVEWTRVGMNSDQRQAYLAASQPVKYAGPVGVWTVQFDACKFPPGMSAEQQNQAKGWNLNIAADGNCSMTFSGETVRLHAIKGDNNELKLVPENRPPFICNGSDEWKTIRLNLPPSFTLVFVKDAK